jgi:hypothetical protein
MNNILIIKDENFEIGNLFINFDKPYAVDKRARYDVSYKQDDSKLPFCIETNWLKLFSRFPTNIKYVNDSKYKADPIIKIVFPVGNNDQGLNSLKNAIMKLDEYMSSEQVRENIMKKLKITNKDFKYNSLMKSQNEDNDETEKSICLKFRHIYENKLKTDKIETGLFIQKNNISINIDNADINIFSEFMKQNMDSRFIIYFEKLWVSKDSLTYGIKLQMLQVNVTTNKFINNNIMKLSDGVKKSISMFDKNDKESKEDKYEQFLINKEFKSKFDIAMSDKRIIGSLSDINKKSEFCYDVQRYTDLADDLAIEI